MKKKKNKRIIILVIVVIILLILLAILGFAQTYKNQNDIANSDSVIDGKSISSIINDLGSLFIDARVSEEDGFSRDIYLKFKYDLYEDGKSQKIMYENLIRHISYSYKESIRLIDESRDIIIRIVYDKQNDEFYYTINGEENYFENHDSQNTINSKLNVEETKLTVESNVLKSLIGDNFTSSENIYGSKESIYDNYDIYFDEGIEVRNISKNAFNIIFTNNYKENVVNNIKVGTSLNKVESILGEPTYKENNVIGYKNDKFYIFFSKDEISVYPIKKYDYSDFEEYLNEYISSNIDVKEFINKLTYLWDDYSELNYDSEYVDLFYPNQGIELSLNASNPNRIYIYGNYQDLSNVSELIKNNKIKGKLDKDSIFEFEIQRLRRIISILGTEHLDNEEYVGESKLFIETVNNNKVAFYSRDGEYPNCTLVDVVNSYFWLSDSIFVYSVKNNGIYYYNLKTREKSEILVEEGNDYKFNSYYEGILNFDDDRTIEILE